MMLHKNHGDKTKRKKIAECKTETLPFVMRAEKDNFYFIEFSKYITNERISKIDI